MTTPELHSRNFIILVRFIVPRLSFLIHGSSMPQNIITAFLGKILLLALRSTVQ
jgi:hypothetical protein